jgi:hypothetical protein
MDRWATRLVRAAHTAKAVPFDPLGSKAEVLQTTRERGFRGNAITFLGGAFFVPAQKEDMTILDVSSAPFVFDE